MTSFAKCAALSACAITVVGLGACGPSGGGGGGTTVDGGTTDSGIITESDAGSDAGVSALGFQPSNFDLSTIDTSKVVDQHITSNCMLGSDGGSCFNGVFADFATATATQSDGTKVAIIVVKSLLVDAGAEITVNGDMPLILVALGDMSILGTMDAHASGGSGYLGGFTQSMANTAGTGPGGGPAATGIIHSTPGLGAGGGSYCGKGGLGAVEPSATGTQTAAATYGSADIRPLTPGSSGGNGAAGDAGAGGGALQLVAGGTFSMGASSYINVGGGGGNFGGFAGQNAGGGGSGGALLIEAMTVNIAGILAANGGGGGGGGGATSGTDGSANATPAPGGTKTGDSPGGAGGAGGTPDGTAGLDVNNDAAGGGGGGVGRIRINTSSGTATLTGTISPTSATGCATVGTVRAAGSGA